MNIVFAKRRSRDRVPGSPSQVILERSRYAFAVILKTMMASLLKLQFLRCMSRVWPTDSGPNIRDSPSAVIESDAS